MINYELETYLNTLLQTNNFQDYCPNGLQIEGDPYITKIITGVSLNEQLIDVAIQKKANAIIVHHGVFWNFDKNIITKVKKLRIAKILKQNINLYAYHLPLDNHNTMGNNVMLAQQLNLKIIGNTDKQGLLWYGQLENPCPLNEFIAHIDQQLKRKPAYFIRPELLTKTINNIAWCTGGADSFFTTAIDLNVDAFITGECKEHIMHMALESDVCFIAAGHYATERYGIEALTNHIQQTHNIDAKFIDIYNPI